MNDNDFFVVSYKILSYLKYCYENDERVDPTILSEGMLSISYNQFLKTLKMLIDQGYIDGVYVKQTIDGMFVLNNRSKSAITMSGLDYLKNDRSMKEAFEQLGPVQKWLPIIK